MKPTTACALTNSAIWISSCAVIGIGLFLTRSMHCLWFLLIPASSGFVTRSIEPREEDEEVTEL